MKTCLLFACMAAFAAHALAQGTAFTYQGRLNDGASAANGIYDLRFTIYDSASDGAIQGGPITNSATSVSDGLFTATLNFGAGIFNGASRFLEIAVRTNGGGAFTALTPRQAITATPYAITASNLSGTLPATQLTGTLPDARLSGNVSLLGATVDSAEIADGSIVNADLSPSAAIADSKLATLATAGKVADSALSANVSKLGASIDSAEITDGTIVNADLSGSAAIADTKLATISTAGKVADSALPANIARLNGTNVFTGTNRFSGVMIATNASNLIGGSFSGTLPATQLTGTLPDARLSASVSLLGTNIDSAEITDGTITTNDLNATVLNSTFWKLGGNAGTNPTNNFLGTTDNQPLEWRVNGQRGLRLEFVGDSDLSAINVIGGSHTNSVGAAFGATIAGGGNSGEPQLATGSFSTVGGGKLNTASGLGSTIAGGLFHTASAVNSTISGGSQNTASGDVSTVPGGYQNIASGRFSFAAGLFAHAKHEGAFVWADSATQFPHFASTGNNQFLIRASGGVAIGTNDPAGAALRVAGSIKADSYFGMGSTLMLGTTDNQPLEFKVNNQRGLRLEYAHNGDFPSVNVIGGDGSNSVSSGVIGGTIAGGGASGFSRPNQVHAAFGTVGGGAGNIASDTYATVPGGFENNADGSYSFAAGRRAKANHPGAFVWADSQNADFASTANNQFNVRANGGVRHFTGGTGLKLDTDTVVISGSAQQARFGLAANVDINPLTSLDGLLIEQGNSESSGIFFDGDSVTMWSPGDNNRLFRILDTDAMGSGAAAAVRFAVDGAGGIFCAGDVGIRTDTPDRPLTIQGTGDNGEWLSLRNSSGATKWHLNHFNGGLNFVETGVADNRLFLRAGGNVGIGTSTPDFRLEVNGSAGKPGGGSWSVASDARLKKTVADLHGSLDRLLRLRSVSFEYKDPAKGVSPGPQIGFIAQEVREVLPQWVTEGPDGMLAVSVTGFESLTVDALRELRAEKDQQIGELKAENAALKQRLEKIEQLLSAKLAGDAR